MNRKYKIGILILIFGLLLMGINIAGFFIPLRNADIYTEKQNYFKDDILFNEQELLSRLERKNESDEVFVTRVNDLIFNGIAHYWKEEGIKKYNIRVPIHENYLLFMAGTIFPSKFEMYEFTDYKKGIERGVGLCSQHSIILSEILERNKVKTQIVGMSCHVVVMAQVDKTSETWWLLDPDFGVIIKKNISEIRNSPEKIQAIYRAKGYDDSTIKRLSNCYGNVDRIYDGAIEYSGKKRYYIEKFTYVGKWLIPILLLMISINLITKNKS